MVQKNQNVFLFINCCLYAEVARNLEKNGGFINFLHQQNVKIFKVPTFVHL